MFWKKEQIIELFQDFFIGVANECGCHNSLSFIVIWGQLYRYVAIFLYKSIELYSVLPIHPDLYYRNYKEKVKWKHKTTVKKLLIRLKSIIKTMAVRIPVIPALPRPFCLYFNERCLLWIVFFKLPLKEHNDQVDDFLARTFLFLTSNLTSNQCGWEAPARFSVV